MSSHYDSALNVRAASDDLSNIAMMLEVLRALTHSEPLPMDLIFNFNGAEETILQVRNTVKCLSFYFTRSGKPRIHHTTSVGKIYSHVPQFRECWWRRAHAALPGRAQARVHGSRLCHLSTAPVRQQHLAGHFSKRYELN